MNIARPDKIVLLGFLSHFPVAGVAWQTLHYLAGFQRLGYEVYYVEAHGCTPSKLMQSAADDGAARAAAYISGLMHRFGLDRHWAYQAIYEGRCFGLSATQLKELYRSAALLINLHGSHLPTPELTATNRLVYLGTDPVDIEVDVFNRRQEAIDYLKPHCAFFSFGENLGRPDCLVPRPEPFEFRPTRQPVVMEFWEHQGAGEAATFTTIGNWRQPWREIHFQGQTYTWSKHAEFRKFIDLPRRVGQPFELALSSCESEDQRELEAHGWRVRPALDLSQDLDVYRRYLAGSRGEFTVAKDQNVRLRSGWFSDRAVTYLAAGRPVITQETGFSNLLPVGAGLFAFSTMDDIVAALDAINADYDRHRRAAWQIARECFSHEVVLGRLLRELGLARPGAPASGTAQTQNDSSALPAGLLLSPIGRWPTRLPAETVQFASALPPPAAPAAAAPPPRGSPPAAAAGRPRAATASIVVVTFNGLPFTKLCLTSLLGNGWHPGDELILVDNASSDGTADFLREVGQLNRFVRVICNGQNRGFAAANNQGLALAGGDVLVLLNNDTLLPPGWRDGLVRWLEDPAIGLVGPLTNRTCNEAQIDAPYRTCGEMEQFARDYTRQHLRQSGDLPMLAMFCLAMRREVFQRVGPLDEQFEVGMFEDDDYSRRVRQDGLRIVCAEDVFVHHFGQASFGELCLTGDYDRVLDANRRRFEAKWGVQWQPHGRRLTPEYRQLRQRIRETVAARVPAGATVLVISKGDNELLQFDGRLGWHFPQSPHGGYANIYPADSAEAIAHLEALHARGGGFLLIPQPAFWWLDHYRELKEHLERHSRLVVRDEATCLIFDLGGGMPSATVIIPVFNQAALTAQCLHALVGREACEVVVVDNASSDATPQMLAGFGQQIKVVRHERNRGFAAACNSGAAAAAAGHHLVFLNNDTRPQRGWLEALVGYAEVHPQAAVVGARLVFPNRTIQHAGVVICQDRYPRHLYAGFPAAHPAVSQSRRFQIVTAACMLVRRGWFEQAGGFDPAFRNGFEDVDLCLRLGQRGQEVHYCAESVVEHLESVSPGRFRHDRDNVALYRQRWFDRVRPDDLDYYLEDGLLRLHYEGRYPISLEVSPLLAALDPAARHAELERALQERSRDMADLQRENTRLNLELGRVARDSPELAYGEMRRQMREAVQQVVPAGATVLVISKGDGALLDLPGCRCWHFPQTARGAYAGHHPAGSAEAIAHLEALREKGADHLLIPPPSFWWLDHYAEFRQHLESRYRQVTRLGDLCRLYVLRS